MILALVLATGAAFVLSAAYYAALPYPGSNGQNERPAAALVGIELARSAAVAGLLAGLVSAADWTTPSQGGLFGLALWTMPVVLLVGSMFHEGTALRLAVLHAGDWLVKLVAIGLIIGWLG